MYIERLSPQQKRQHEFLCDHLIRPGQLLEVFDGIADKYGRIVFDGFNPENKTDREFIAAHLLACDVNRGVRVHVRVEDNPEGTLSESVLFSKVLLGIRYPTWNTTSKQITCSSFALDCDDAGDGTALTKCLEAFPGAFVARKANGKWHLHANLAEAYDAHVVKRWIYSKLPSEWKVNDPVEVFPKIAESRTGETFYTGNLVRLPWGVSGYDAEIPATLPTFSIPENFGQHIQAFISEPEYECSVGASAKLGMATTPPSPALETYDSPFYEGVTKDERARRYAAYLRKYESAISGHQGHKTLLLAVAHRHGFGVSAAEALPLLYEFNNRCVPPWSEGELLHKLRDAKPLPAWPAGCRLRETHPQVEDTEVADAWREHVPAWESIGAAIAGTPMETYMTEAQRLSPYLPRGMILADSLVLAGLLCVRAGATVGLSADDYERVQANLYLLKAAPSGSGKGLSTGLLRAMASRYGIAVEEIAASASGLIDSLKAHERGPILLWMDEGESLFDSAHAGYAQVLPVLTKLFSSGAASHRTKPGGKTTLNAVVDTWPSMAIDVTPAKMRGGADSIGAGLVPRMLCVGEYVATGFTRENFPNCAAIESAYRPYAEASGRVVRLPIERPTSPMLHAMNEDERAHINRLYSLMLQKFALILHIGLGTGDQIANDEWARALVLCDFFAAEALNLRRCLVTDAEESLRVRLENYVLKYRTARYEAALLMMQVNAWRFKTAILGTCCARGTLQWDEKTGIITPGGALPDITQSFGKQRVLELVRKHAGISRARLESTFKIPAPEIAAAIENGEIKVEVSARGAEKLLPAEPTPPATAKPTPAPAGADGIALEPKTEVVLEAKRIPEWGDPDWVCVEEIRDDDDDMTKAIRSWTPDDYFN